MPGIWYPRCYAVLGVVLDEAFAETPFGQIEIGAEADSARLVPMNARVSLNGYSQADTFDLEFDARRLPFTPELIRACEVQIYTFHTRSLSEDVTPYLADERYRRIVGLIDDADFEVSVDGRIFRCSGRDYTCLMLDKTWDGRKRVATGRSIVETVQELVDEAAKPGPGQTNGLTVRFVDPSGSLPDGPTVEAGLSLVKKKRGLTMSAGQNYWDVIARICQANGCICFVRGFEVIVSRPQLLLADASSRVTRVAWGRNLSSLIVSRHFGKELVPQMVCTSTDLDGNVIRGVFPPTAKTPVRIGIGTKNDEQEIVPVPWVRDERVLAEYAEARYNTKARSEATITFATKDLQDLGDGLDRRDIDALLPGDPVQIGFEPVNEAELRKLGRDRRYQYLRDIGFEHSVAQAIDAGYEQLNGWNHPFYTRTVDIDWADGDDGGLETEVEAVNFISVGRDDPSLEEELGRGA